VKPLFSTGVLTVAMAIIGFFIGRHVEEIDKKFGTGWGLAIVIPSIIAALFGSWLVMEIFE
jgi:putative Mn2+ efflux pump MntP